MNSSLNDLVPCFYGRDVSDEGGQQDPAEFIETLLFAIDGQIYTDEARRQTATRVIFRINLRDKALTWYQSLAAEVRGSWESLEAIFLTRFALVPRKAVDQTRFLNLVVNFRQRGRSIVEYTREGDKLNAECPEKFRDVLGHQFIAGLDDKGKVDLVQVYLGANKLTVSYADARQAVEEAYQRFGEPSPFDDLRSQPSSPPPTPALQSELVALLQCLRILQAQALPSRDIPSYRPNYANTNVRDQIGHPSFYRGIYCHNCREEGHYSTSCTRPVVSGAQRNANRWAIDELQGGPRQYPQGSGTIPGLPPAQSALAVVASGGVERQKQGGQRMNNIGVANVVILKRPVVKESHESASAKVSKLQDFCSTSQLTKPAVSSVEHSLAQPESRNLELLNEKTIHRPSFSSPLPEDDNIEDNARVNGDSYEMSGVLSTRQEICAQFKEEDDRLCDIAEPMHCQGELLPMRRQQEVANIRTDCFETKESISIEGGEDRPPQLKERLARAMASLWCTERKSAGPNLGGTVAVAVNFWTPPALKPVLHKENEGHDQLSLKKWTCNVDWGPGAKTIWGRNIPEILPLIRSQVVRLGPAETMLGFVPKWKVIQGLVQKTRPDIRHGATREAAQRDIKEIEEGSDESLIEKMMDDNGKSSKLLWFNLHQKITRHLKGTHKPPDWISRGLSAVERQCTEVEAVAGRTPAGLGTVVEPGVWRRCSS